MHSLTLERAQGLRLTEAFYWDLNDKTRAFSKRFAEKFKGKMPTSVQAGFYSATLAYLNAVKAAGTDDRRQGDGADEGDQVGRPGVRQELRSAPTAARCTTCICSRSRAPAESKGPWDYYKLLATIPADEAFRPMDQGNCPMVAKKN